MADLVKSYTKAQPAARMAYDDLGFRDTFWNELKELLGEPDVEEESAAPETVKPPGPEAVVAPRTDQTPT